MAGPVGTERDDHHEQNSAYSPPASSSAVPLAQSAERRSVEPEVGGSKPPSCTTLIPDGGNAYSETGDNRMGDREACRQEASQAFNDCLRQCQQR